MALAELLIRSSVWPTSGLPGATLTWSFGFVPLSWDRSDVGGRRGDPPDSPTYFVTSV